MTNEEAGAMLHAYVDGELEPSRCVELEAHLAANPAARAACERLRGMSAAIREKADYHAAPATLLGPLLAQVSGPAASPATSAPRPSIWRLLPGTGVAMAAAAFLTWTIATGYLRPGETERITQEVLSSHVRATLAQHSFDVASSDQHTVKPWLSSRLNYSPPVIDLSAQGFELRGARLDYVGGQPVAVLVYQRRHHVIDAYVRPAHGPAAAVSLTRDGFNIQSFARDGMEFWLVSDLNRNELSDLARLLAQNPA
ncbi:MAG TPA: anti-sigma factor [Burkholderiales bacterium]|nr:anti-sigma factor [Burkholderiales bacterium]